MVNDINQIKFMRNAFLPILPLVYDDALSYIEFLGKVSEKCNEIIVAMNNIEVNILEQAEAYTDSKVTELRSTLDEEMYMLRKDTEAFKSLITTEISNIMNEVNLFNDALVATANAINQRTDIVIEENNQKIMKELSKYLAEILVVNYITGEDMSVQNMFDYLCMFHLTDPLTYTQLVAKDNTYTELVAYDMTYTDLVTNGNSIIQ